MNIYSSFSQLSQRTMILLNLLRHSTQVQNTFLTTSQEAAGFRRVSVDGADRSLTYEVVGAAQVVVPHCDLQSLVGQL